MQKISRLPALCLGPLPHTCHEGQTRLSTKNLRSPSHVSVFEGKVFEAAVKNKADFPYLLLCVCVI